jgi:nuclear receptor subfamily 1 group I
MAARSLSEPVDQDADRDFLRYSTEPSLISVINLTDLAIKRIIKMAKQIQAFSRLCQEDQVPKMTSPPMCTAGVPAEGRLH